MNNNGWKPIETAPDNQFVLIYPVGDGYPAGHSAVAEKKTYHGKSDWYLGGSCGSNDNPLCPTHWQPLPEPPND